MEIKNKDYFTPLYKSVTISVWKNNLQIKHDDFDALFEEYINTNQCNHCAKPFKSTKDRCVDHDHETGIFRKIVCHKCNSCDSYIKYPNGYNAKEYYEKNKEYIKEYSKQRLTCDCGSVVGIKKMSRHKRSMKHMDWFMNSVD